MGLRENDGQDNHKLEQFDHRTKHLVYGFCRMQQNILTSIHGNNAFYIIPDGVICQCLLYSHYNDYFDIAGEDARISSTRMYNDTLHASAQDSYGKMIIPSMNKGIYKWKFKIISSNKSAEVGIVDASDFSGIQYIYIDNFEDGDILEMTLDLSNRKISWIKNDICDQIFDNVTQREDLQYRMYFLVYSKYSGYNVCVQLLSYDEIHSKWLA